MPQQKTTLRRSLGLWLLLFYGLGNILGAGIYVLVGKVAGVAGYFAPISFLLSAIVAGFTALTYAELSSRYPVAAGEAVYLQKGFNKNWLSVIAGILIAMSGMLSAATITRGFAGYMHVFTDLPGSILMITVLLILGLVAIWGISESIKIAAAFTVVEIAGLLFIIIKGSNGFENLPTIVSSMPALTELYIWPGIFAGAFLAFFAYIGFEDMVNVAEEVREPEKNMPMAIMLAFIISIVLYALISLVTLTHLSPEQLRASEAPLADVYVASTGGSPFIITVISLFAIINGALIQIIMASRIFYGMSMRGWFPEIFSKVNKVTQTPVFSTLMVVGIISFLALWFPIQKLAESTSYLILTVFVLINVALIRIRKRYPLPVNVKGYPAWVPVLGTAGSLFLLAAQLSTVFK